MDASNAYDSSKNQNKPGELTEDSTIRKIRIVQIEGKREVESYNLDVIIEVGYRVNSFNATQFRVWATQTFNKMKGVRETV